MEHPRSLFGPLLLIAAGAIWLLVKSGSIPATNLWALTHVWPYLLIAAGAGLILRPYWRYTSWLFDVIIIGGTVAAIFLAPQLQWDNPSIVSIMGDGDFYVGPGERGSGNIISQTREVSDFTSIKVDYPAQVFVSQGNSVSLKVEADDNLLPGLRTQVRNDVLEISYKADNGKHVNPSKPVKITIVVKDLRKVSFSSAGELTIDGLESNGLDISVSGAGNLKLNDVQLKELSVNLSGAGNLTSSGAADELNLNISGFGNFSGKDLHSQNANVNLSGAGSASLWVDKYLDAKISGAGSISYYGSAEVNQQINGLGSVTRLGSK